MARDYDAFGDVRNTQAGIFGSEQASLEPALRNHKGVTSIYIYIYIYLYM